MLSLHNTNKLLMCLMSNFVDPMAWWNHAPIFREIVGNPPSEFFLLFRSRGSISDVEETSFHFFNLELLCKHKWETNYRFNYDNWTSNTNLNNAAIVMSNSNNRRVAQLWKGACHRRDCHSSWFIAWATYSIHPPAFSLKKERNFEKHNDPLIFGQKNGAKSKGAIRQEIIEIIKNASS